MSKENRALLESTLFNLTYDMEYIGCAAEMYEEIAAMTDSDLEWILNDILSKLD